MSILRIAVVVIVVAVRHGGPGLLNRRVVVRRDVSKMMMAEREDEVQRERGKRKPGPEPHS
jgi:hypothetical protein